MNRTRNNGEKAERKLEINGMGVTRIMLQKGTKKRKQNKKKKYPNPKQMYKMKSCGKTKKKNDCLSNRDLRESVRFRACF